MCSVIEIKNTSEYYIHYHGPESMDPSNNASVIEAKTASEAGKEDKKNKKTSIQIVPEEEDVVQDPADEMTNPDTSLDNPEKDYSVVEITQALPTVIKEGQETNEDETSDKGSSLEGSSSSQDRGKSPKRDVSVSSKNHDSDVTITVNSHIPSSPSKAMKTETKLSAEMATQVEPSTTTTSDEKKVESKVDDDDKKENSDKKANLAEGVNEVSADEKKVSFNEDQKECKKLKKKKEREKEKLSRKESKKSEEKSKNKNKNETKADGDKETTTSSGNLRKKFAFVIRKNSKKQKDKPNEVTAEAAVKTEAEVGGFKPYSADSLINAVKSKNGFLILQQDDPAKNFVAVAPGRKIWQP